MPEYLCKVCISLPNKYDGGHPGDDCGYLRDYFDVNSGILNVIPGMESYLICFGGQPE